HRPHAGRGSGRPGPVACGVFSGRAPLRPGARRSCPAGLRGWRGMTPGRLAVPARTAWAGMLAYSRAVRVGRHVFVSGTLPVDEQGRLVGGDDAGLQARHVLTLIQQAIAEAGADICDVVRLRIYLRDMADLAAVAAAQWAVFEHVRPACTV